LTEAIQLIPGVAVDLDRMAESLLSDLAAASIPWSTTAVAVFMIGMWRSSGGDWHRHAVCDVAVSSAAACGDTGREGA